MSEVSENKRIAKNTMYLYLRMILLLVIGIFTSRVTLAALGISDYGIYNVVGGIVSMFVFINYAMINSTQRYVTYELGRGDQKRLSLIFSTSINIHAIIALIIIVLSETVGLWFFYNKMTIPSERMDAAFWLFQFSIISCFVNIMSVPYNALIIAHEKMSAFAYMSLLDTAMKLGVVYLLVVYDGDRLVFYGVLVLLVTIIDRVIYGQYCIRKFPESEYHFMVDKSLMKEMTSFASWNLLGNLSYVCYTQGVNLLLNVFFNPVVNAARGIAVQIQTVVSNFSYSVENAIKPQITKSYAQQDMQRMHTLIFLSAKVAFFVLLLLSLPIILEANQLLNLWLVEVPEHTVNFVRLTILTLLTESLTNPLLTAAQATGDMKKYQFSVSLLCLFILPVSYVALLISPIPELVFIVSIVFSISMQFVKLWIVSRQISLSKILYLKEVFFRTMVVFLLSLVLSSTLLFLMDAGIIRLIFLSLFSCVIVLLSIYTFGINKNERKIVNMKSIYYMHKYLKR